MGELDKQSQPTPHTAATPDAAKGTPGKHSLTAGLDEAAGTRKTEKAPSVFAHATATLKKSARTDNNQATAAKDKGANIRVFSPGVEMVGDVALKKDVDPDPAQLTVGWVQVLESSHRVGIYEEAGKVKTRQILQMPAGVLDGQWIDRDDSGHGERAAVKPWYQVPLTIDGTNRTAKPFMADQPKFMLPKKMGKAKLVEVQGADTFTASLKAGGADGSNLVTLKSFNWATPWAMKISDKQNEDGFLDGRGSGDMAIASTNKSAEAKDQRHPNQIAAGGGIMVSTYESLEAAQSALAELGYSKFVKDINTHKQLAPESYWHMVGALWKTQLRIHAKVKASDPGDVAVSFSAHRTVSLEKGKPFGSDFTYSAITHMVIDPASVGDGKPVTISVDGKVVCTLKFPFSGANGSGRVVSMWGDWSFDVDAYIR